MWLSRLPILSVCWMLFFPQSKTLLAESLLSSSSSVLDEDDDYPNCTDRPPRQDMYDVVVTELDAVENHGASLISRINGSSDFEFNFSPAYIPASSQLKEGLVVRLVDFIKHPEWANAGAMAVVPVRLDPQSKPLAAQHVTESMITWAGARKPGPHEEWGAADPRMTYRPKTQQYYLTWDNCTKNCWPHRVTYLSTTNNPYDPSGWTFHGQVFPFPYTSGAALLFRDDDDDDEEEHHANEGDEHIIVNANQREKPPHLAFICNSNTADTLFIVESYDENGLNWTIPQDPDRRILMKGRPGCWDASGIAAGPPPERLSTTGDYLLIYNIDTGWPYHPNPLGRCAIGWAILDKNDPTKIIARSTHPLLIATRPWETCPRHGRHDPTCQEPMVVFATGLKPIVSSKIDLSDDITDEFYVTYGAADSNVAVSKLQVKIKNSKFATAN